MRTLSLFSGIGGLDLGLERAGFQIVAQCEQDPFCRAVLAKHWPGVPCWSDIRELVALLMPLRRLPAHLRQRSRELKALLADLFAVVGGFPCQDVSVAGKGAGVEEGARSGLWMWMRRVIAVVRPRWIIAENVPALRTRGADRVLGDLEGIGYTCTPLVVGAGDVGAPHRRQRVFIVAHAANAVFGAQSRGARGGEGTGEGEARRWPVREGLRGSDDGRPANAGADLAHAPGGGLGADGRPRGDAGHADECGAELENSDRDGLRAGGRTQATDAHEAGEIVADADGRESRAGLRVHAGRRGPDEAPSHDQWPSPPGQPQHAWEAPRILELPVVSATDGLSPRLVRFANRCALKAAGNAVVPQVAEVVGRAVMAAELGGVA